MPQTGPLQHSGPARRHSARCGAGRVAGAGSRSRRCAGFLAASSVRAVGANQLFSSRSFVLARTRQAGRRAAKGAAIRAFRSTGPRTAGMTLIPAVLVLHLNDLIRKERGRWFTPTSMKCCVGNDRPATIRAAAGCYRLSPRSRRALSSVDSPPPSVRRSDSCARVRQDARSRGGVLVSAPSEARPPAPYPYVAPSPPSIPTAYSAPRRTARDMRSERPKRSWASVVDGGDLIRTGGQSVVSLWPCGVVVSINYLTDQFCRAGARY